MMHFRNPWAGRGGGQNMEAVRGMVGIFSRITHSTVPN